MEISECKRILLATLFQGQPNGYDALMSLLETNRSKIDRVFENEKADGNMLIRASGAKIAFNSMIAQLIEIKEICTKQNEAAKP